MPRRPTASSDTVAPSVAFTSAIATSRAIREQPTGSSTSTYVPVPLVPTTPMRGDTGEGGAAGLVPAPVVGDAGKYLRGDGTWATPIMASLGAEPAGYLRPTRYERDAAAMAQYVHGYDTDRSMLAGERASSRYGIPEVR